MPQHANAGTEFKWSFLWLNVMHFPASNALNHGSTYWLSARNVKQDHWEAEFDIPQKLDLIEIYWRLPPKQFRVFIKLDEKSDYIPVTAMHTKIEFINAEGKRTNQDAVNERDIIKFNKPVYAKKVRINLNTPLKHHSFSIFSVRFFQRKTIMIIKNELVDPSQHYCFYINSNLPRNGSKVEAYPCIQAIAVPNNHEMWIAQNDNSIKHMNSQLCIGFNIENVLTLRNCGGIPSTYTIQHRADNTLFFTGYNDKCIILDQDKKLSDNFIDETTEIVVTTQADDQTFKKENISVTGENFWHSSPGQKKVTIQILFGKIKEEGIYKGKYENKKIDLIVIDWIKEPKKFSIYTWKPGKSWTLRYTFNDYRSKLSQINVIGESAAAIMIILEESHNYEELNNQPAYAIRQISAYYKSMAIKNAECSNFADTVKIFDMDPQSYFKLEHIKDYDEVRSQLSISYDKIISNFSNIKSSIKYIYKAREKAREFLNKINKVKKIIAEDTISKLRKFKHEILKIIKNSIFLKYLKSSPFSSFIKKNITDEKIGSKKFPARDCLALKKMNKNVLSGWYYVKPDCTPKPIRVFCDFTLYQDAVDIFVFNDDNKEPNPNLSYLGIKDFNSIRYQCAKHGLYAIQINNRETVSRIFQLLRTLNYDLSKPIAIPLGYDFTCQSGKCKGIPNSINDKQSPSVASFFKSSSTGIKGSNPNGAFVGLGFSNEPNMLKFSPENVPIGAIICSSNHTKTDFSDAYSKLISCDLSPASSGSLFTHGSTILVDCPSSCIDSMVNIYGNNIYHLKSSVCKAAIHSGNVGSKGGKVNVRVIKGLKNYLGSTSNGIKSNDYDEDDGMDAFTIVKYEPKCPIDLFKDLANEEKINVKEESESPQSSFMETEFSSSLQTAALSQNTLSLSLVKEKFRNDIRSNELEGVDINEIEKAGIKSELSLYIDHTNNNQDNIHNFNPEYSATTISGITDEMIHDVNNLVEYNNHSVPDNYNTFDINDSDTDSNFKFRESLYSEDPTPPNPQTSAVTNMLNDINSATNNLSNNIAASANSNLKLSESKAPTNDSAVSANKTPENNTPINELPNAPKPGQTEPTPPVEKPVITTNIRIEPTTDEGNIIISKIRDVVDTSYLKSLKKKLEAVLTTVNDYKKNLSWSNEGSVLSIGNIQCK